MKFVEFYKLENDGTQSVIAKCTLDVNGMIKCEGNINFINSLEKEGILNYAEPGHPALFFKDGIKFLEQLKFNFNSGYLNASDVMEK